MLSFSLGSWRVSEGPGGLQEAFPPILVHISPSGHELWPKIPLLGILFTEYRMLNILYALCFFLKTSGLKSYGLMPSFRVLVGIGR